MIEDVLSAGGDDRVSVVDGVNQYRLPLISENFLNFSSSTCNVQTEEEVAYLEYLVKILGLKGSSIDESQYKEGVLKIRNELRVIFGLEDSTDIVLGPSGTDLEMVPNFIGLSQGKKVVNLMALSSETGRAGSTAASLQRFSESRAYDVTDKYQRQNIETIELPCSYDDSTVEEIVRQNEGAIFLLRHVHCSKTGRSSCEFQSVIEMTSRLPNLFVVVDACQGRVAREDIKTFERLGMIVNFTGSKFFSSAPFCGCLFFPKSYKQYFEKDSKLQVESLANHFCRWDFPAKWSLFDFLHSYTHRQNYNAGLILRWLSALKVIRDFYSIHEVRLNNLLDQVRSVVVLAVNRSERLNLVEVKYVNELAFKTLFNLAIADRNGNLLSYTRIQEMYPQLIEYLVTRGISVGQPTYVAPNVEVGVIRLSVGAPWLVKSGGSLTKDVTRYLIEKLEFSIAEIDRGVREILE